MSVWGDDLRALLRRMWNAGELDREEGQWGQSRIRYSRRKPDGTILDLEYMLGGA
jgi:hypothetical protein